AEAVDRLAEAERRPPAELLEELLLPPADRLAFLPDGEAVPGHFPLPDAARLLDVVRGLLGCARGLAAPLDPLANGPDTAWLERCLVAWPRPGEFSLTVACLLGPGNEGGQRLVPALSAALSGLAEAPEDVAGWLAGPGAALGPVLAEAPEGGLTVTVRLS